MWCVWILTSSLHRSCPESYLVLFAQRNHFFAKKTRFLCLHINFKDNDSISKEVTEHFVEIIVWAGFTLAFVSPRNRHKFVPMSHISRYISSSWHKFDQRGGFSLLTIFQRSGDTRDHSVRDGEWYVPKCHPKPFIISVVIVWWWWQR